jgi:uncharacterized hydrophobic protein (TIGR00271 family)
MTDATPAPKPSRTATLRLFRRFVRSMQATAAAAVGIDATHRVQTVVAMLDFNARRAPGYWIQLFLAAGIAILGLVLGSTAVVIGAMLVSPLMGPIIELGMGFAVGSAFLVIRSSLRVILSVITVILGTAVVTMLLPFHEVTSEIASRTVPTALDLLVAVFCALTAAYTTVRQTSDTTSAAAGTAIGIALVPPLCVIGYGVGTLSLEVAGGAALLFVANLSAILLFAVLSFLLLGYNDVDAEQLAADHLGGGRTRTDLLAGRVQQWVTAAFGSRYGFGMRLVVPVLFLASVYFPLRKALDEVAWQVRTRTAVARILEAEAGAAVQRTVSVERGAVAVQLLQVGDTDGAEVLERRLETAIAAATGVAPSVRVLAVPDAGALTALARTPTPAAPPPETPPVEAVRARLGGVIQRVWPREASGPLAGWSLEVAVTGQPVLVARHFGPPLGAAGEALLGAALATPLGTAPRVRDEPLDSTPVLPGRDLAAWLDGLAPQFALAPRLDGATACVTRPASDSTSDAVVELRRRVATAGSRVTVVPGEAWSFRWTTGSCQPPVAGREP